MSGGESLTYLYSLVKLLKEFYKSFSKSRKVQKLLGNQGNDKKEAEQDSGYLCTKKKGEPFQERNSPHLSSFASHSGQYSQTLP